MSDRDDAIDGNLSDTSYSRIAATLIQQGIRAGDQLPSESTLCATLAMGRQQVREGLSVLEAFGAVVSRQGARRVWRGLDIGAMVTSGAALHLGDGDSARELLEVRHALETSLLPTVASRLSEEDLADLRALADEMVKIADAGGSFAAIDAQFHRRLFAPLDNSVLNGILQAFWSQFDATPAGGETVVENPEVARMHAHIVDALAAGDQRLAVHELDAHFYGVRQRFPGGSHDRIAAPVLND